MHVKPVKSVLKIVRCLSTTSAIPSDFVSGKTNLLYLEQRDISSNYRRFEVTQDYIWKQ